MPAAAPQPKRATTGADGPAKRKRRRRNVRTAVSDSDSSSSSDSSDSSDSESENEVEMQDAPVVAESDSEVSGGEEEEGAEEEGAKGRLFTEKSGRVPEQLRDLHDPQADAKFEEYYMRLMTGEFGDDLNAVRQAKDFGDRSLPVLVRALRQGVNIFSPEEKRVVVGAAAAGGK